MLGEAIEPVLRVTYEVIAYDCSGYGDNRSRSFTNGIEAVEYAEGLADNFQPMVIKRITMDDINQTIYDRRKK